MTAADLTQTQSKVGGAGSVPVPDPTVLTTEALQREILHVREIAELREKYTAELAKTREECAAELRVADEKLQKEKFESVKEQQQLGERLRLEQKADTALAVGAALSAAKEAVAAQASAFSESVNKAEVSMTKQLESIATTFGTQITNLAAQIGDLKESRSFGAGKAAAWGVAIAFALAIGALFGRFG